MKHHIYLLATLTLCCCGLWSCAMSEEAQETDRVLTGQHADLAAIAAQLEQEVADILAAMADGTPGLEGALAEKQELLNQTYAAMAANRKARDTNSSEDTGRTIGLILGGLSGLGAGVFGGRLGPSRSKRAIEDAMGKIDQLQGMVDSFQKGITDGMTATDAPTTTNPTTPT